MLHFEEPVKALTISPWLFGVGGVIALAIGLLFVIRPRKSGKVWWKIQQGMSPYRVPKELYGRGAVIAVGCLALLIAAAFLWTTWSILQR
jgi:uncharacterized membrane protein HdeD (DUF308 family)